MAAQMQLHGKKVAILATDGVERVELLEPKKALDEAGAQTVVISPKTGKIKTWDHGQWGDDITVDQSLDIVREEDFDALMLPGGVMNPDRLRQNVQAVQFVRSFFDVGKPVAAICHAPWMLVEADVLSGRTVTSWPSLRTDIRNAGGEWVDREVVTDEGLVTSRKPDDIPAFNRKMIEEFAEGVHQPLSASARQARARERPEDRQIEVR